MPKTHNLIHAHNNVIQKIICLENTK